MKVQKREKSSKVHRIIKPHLVRKVVSPKKKEIDIIITEVTSQSENVSGEPILRKVDETEVAENQNLSYQFESDLVLCSDDTLVAQNKDTLSESSEEIGLDEKKPKVKKEKNPSGKRYPTNLRFRSKWSEDLNLRDWLAPHPDNPNKVTCTFCRCFLRAHKTDLYKHLQTSKHKKYEIKFANKDGKQEKAFLRADGTKGRKKKKLKTEKLATADGSYILIQSESGIINSERDGSENFMEYDANHIIDGQEVEIHEKDMSSPTTDQEITTIASRVGAILIEDIESILRKQVNILKCFKENGESVINESNLHRIAKICVGHLSQKYLVRAALESNTHISPAIVKEKKDLTSKFKVIEDKLDRTVAEMKKLKMTFDDASDDFPFSAIDLGELLSTPSTSDK